MDALISCAADLRRVHLQREVADAIAVGRITWDIDRPRLDARAEWLGRSPRRQRVYTIGRASITDNAAHFDFARRVFVS